MDERLVEIIIAIVDKLADREIPSKTVESLTSSLVADGYSIGEINTAFMWLYHTVDESFFEEGRILAEYGSKSTLRMLNEFEKSMINGKIQLEHGVTLKLKLLMLMRMELH